MTIPVFLMYVAYMCASCAQAMYQEMMEWEARASGVKLGVTVSSPTQQDTTSLSLLPQHAASYSMSRRTLLGLS